jgi:hypothetical protein
MISSPRLPSLRLARAAGAAGLVALALPVAAQAASSHGVVVSVTPKTHSVSLVNSAHTVQTLSYPSSVSGLRTGSEFVYTASGSAVKSGHVTGTASSFSFDATVASVKGKSVALTMPGGSHLTVSAQSTSGVLTGDTVAATEKRAGKSWNVTLKVLKKVASTAGLPSTPRITSAATITSIGANSLGLLLANGQSLTAALPASAVNYFTSNDVMRLCETATVVYQTAGGGALIDTGVSTSSAVALAQGTCSSDSDGEIDLVGNILSISSSTVTLSLPGGIQVSIPLAPGRDLQADENAGDLADVTYNPSSDTAFNVESSELYTTGVVTKVSPFSMTIKNAVTGASEVLPPDAAAYANINQGDTVGVVYWIDGGKPKADNISDLTTGASN